jgi:uncharacterized integral membrane protein
VQALWALGVAGALYLLLAHPELPLPLLVAQQPWAVWLVGPAAAAVTGEAAAPALNATVALKLLVLQLG